MDYIFVSYSRRQLYFAESVVFHLQRAGLEVWFDLQKLTPGVEWAAALKDGYGNCRRLILIASRAALQSPYVQVEWETALQHGREVILILTETISVPASLQGCAVYDARVHFDRTMQRLLRYLSGEEPAQSDPIPVLEKSPYTRNMPFDIWLTLGALFMPALTVWIAALVIPTNWISFHADLSFISRYIPGFAAQGVLFYLVGFAVGGYLALVQFPLREFWRHEVQYDELEKTRWNVIVTQVTVLLLVLVSAALVKEGTSQFIIPVIYLILLFTLISAYWAFWTLPRSPDLLRWLPSGEADQEMRELVQGKVSAKIKGPPVAEELHPLKTMLAIALHYHPADSHNARYIESLLRAGGCRAVPENEADTHLVIVSNRTSKAWLRGLDVALSGRIIYVLTTNINTPPDLQPILQTQWVDFRTGRSNTMRALAAHLTGKKNADVNYGLQIAPTAFDTANGFPPQVGYVLGAFFLLVFLLALAMAILPLPIEDWLAFVLIAISGLLLVLYVDALVMRKASLPLLVHKWLGRHAAWFASPAPAAPDAIGNTDRKYMHKLTNWTQRS